MAGDNAASSDPLDPLALADPETALAVSEALGASGRPVAAWELHLLAAETIAALAMGSAFGRAVAAGFLRLVGRVDEVRLRTYAQRLAAARDEGAGLGQLLAEHLPAVLRHGDEGLLAAYDAALQILLAKGIYTLKGPLGLVARLLDNDEKAAARALLDLLATAFALPLTYNRSNYMTQFLPQAVAGMDPQRRAFQIDQLKRVIQVDQQLAEAFVEGLAAGAGTLSAAALDQFVSRALARGGIARMAPFLSLEARPARALCRELQSGASLATMRGQLSAYLQARLGRRVALQALDTEDLDRAPAAGGTALVVSDGRHLYLPAHLDRFTRRVDNESLLKVLVKLEAACFEFGSFDFDMQRYRRLWATQRGLSAPEDGGARSDLEIFLGSFESPGLAEALFTTFEHGRLRLALMRRYPGMARQMAPLLGQALETTLATPDRGGPLLPLYAAVALGADHGPVRRAAGQRWSEVAAWAEKSATDLRPGRPVEASAALAAEAYARRDTWLCGPGADPDTAADRFWTPFGRRLRPDLVGRAQAAHDRTARRLRLALAERGVRVFQSDLRRQLQRRRGTLHASDLRQLIQRAARELAVRDGAAVEAPVDLGDLDLDALLEGGSPSATASRRSEGRAFRYPEWHQGLGEYLVRHTLVRERRLPVAEAGLYRKTLSRHPGLVARIRHSFELLKPQGLQLLRPWREGDSFDYRAMLNFALDKRAGLMPSDRLYVKRIKHRREVALLLLVDLSRSTANLAQGSSQSVLAITQTAIVLLCEALQIVGDRFAIAGFSGTGRLDVDYLRIKDFDDPLDRSVQGRIAAMTPLRATRMGAAIRHASHRLAAVPAKLRLLLVLGDGFPNDTEYKGAAAIADTRRAIQEAHARQIHTRGITVNIGSDARLDDLYGRARHTVIQDVRTLPDRLFEIYGRLTRH